MPPASVSLSKRAQATLETLRKRDYYYDGPNRTVIIAVVIVIVILKLAFFFALYIRCQRRRERKSEQARQIMAQRRAEMRGDVRGGYTRPRREDPLRWADYDASRYRADAGRGDTAQGPDRQRHRGDVDAEIVAAPPPYDHTESPAQEQKKDQIQKPDPAKVDERGEV